ncbi:MAG: bifunctional [glutamate--ammonia ligase]-adenylyl-L-tyrosine phosphorylase/[glutamate--ammonia-ligase] adenylyltransferase [Candidatus Hydrogenedentota bacterium]|uniref:Glutamate-ammonia-ligase adenylyltransferase n=1 Tax=Sumerlaea chitinivorans TaxID=2250252 RepID=A0A2Z4Y4K1_SUMC1|nr:Glutamate-ammonia-ligase adenylyltransferase [Candidatus Sumerlaea chitinivorans]RMH24105.1 MAG: bifunctional [glutamate--ammonia ligase]-adenylyl-L-tyrosine phosphorylase/[glutamate--ammonia-ligase] adenylyltransferase [Candidatus Hydrogenedentota bacterium]
MTIKALAQRLVANLIRKRPAVRDVYTEESLEKRVGALAALLRLESSAYAEGLQGIIEACLETPEPIAALTNFERFFESLEAPRECYERLARDAQALRCVSVLFGYSQFLSDVLIRYPEFFDWLCAPSRLEAPKGTAEYREEALGIVQAEEDSSTARNMLARWRRREILRIGARDLLRHASIEIITHEISDLAQACITAAADVAWREMVNRYGEPQAESELQPRHTAGMCVIGMGKLGGRELNFSSDIDLIFIYEAEGETSGLLPDGRRVQPTSNHQFFNKMGEAIVRFLSEPGEHGNLFRVDMRLRPEGKAGPLARSLESFANYLGQQARDWEKLAYLKARVMCGPAQLAERIYRFTQEFVFDATEPEQIIREIEKLKLMIDREVHLSDLYHREVKRGYGGIREIEFVIAAMQIVYGRTHRALRVRNIFVAIERLREVNLLTADEAEFYLDAYSFLRLVEHRLQMAAEHQTHTLPAQPNQRAILAARCHFASPEEFEAKLSSVTNGVHERFVRFFQQDVTEASRELSDVLVILDQDADESAAIDVLARYHLGNKECLRLIRDLCYGTREVFVSAEGQRYFEQMVPSLLRLTMRMPDPPAVIRNLHSFMLSIKGITYYYELIAQHTDILKLLVLLFGTSDCFSEYLISHPEYFDTLLTSRVLYDNINIDSVRDRVEQALRGARSLDRQLILLRRAVKFELLLAALRRILNLCSLSATLRELSEIADASLGFAFDLAARRMLARIAGCAPHEVEPTELEKLQSEAATSFAVFALGKYGGREINFGSDLDVVYVFDETNAAGQIYLNSLQRAIQFADHIAFVLSEPLAEGRVFSLDVRLRPHGKNAPVVTPFSLYKTYLEQTAEVWEFLALTRARHIAGNVEITREVLATAQREVARRFEHSVILEETLAMRRRLEQSISADESAGLEFKRSAGGLVDIEFLIQYYMLVGRLTWSLHSGQSYFEVLEAAAAQPPCDRNDWEILRATYSYYRHVETAVRLACGERGTTLPKDPTKQRNVAIQCGKENAEELVRELTERMHEVREVFQRCMAHES